MRKKAPCRPPAAKAFLEEDPNADVVPERLADSEIIDGVDCGNVKIIVPKWAKSRKIGKINGEAKNAMTGADAAAEEATTAEENANAAAAQAEAVGGDEANGAAADAKDAATKAGEAATKAQEASEALSNEVDNLKGGAVADDKPYEADESAISAVQAKTKEALDATRKAQKAVEVALKEAKDAKTKALESTEAALKMVTELSEKSDKALVLASDVKQEAGWAVGEVTKTLEAADEVVAALNKKIDEDTGDQAPVFEGIKEGLQASISSAENSKENLNSEIPKLTEAVEAAETAAEPITTAKEDMAGGAGDPTGAGELADAMSSLDTELKNLGAATTKVSMGTEELIKKKVRVAKEAEKAAEFGIPWAPPPETPFGAPGEGRVEFLSVGAW